MIVRKLSDGIYWFEKMIIIILLIFMVTVIMLGVLYRYFLKSPLSWSDELAIYGLVWVTFIGGSMSIKKNKAAVVSFVMERLPNRVSKILVVTGCFITLIFCGFCLNLALKWITNPAILLQHSSEGFPMIIPYMGIPLGLLFMTVHSLDLLISTIQGKKREGTE